MEYTFVVSGIEEEGRDDEIANYRGAAVCTAYVETSAKKDHPPAQLLSSLQNLKYSPPTTRRQRGKQFNLHQQQGAKEANDSIFQHPPWQTAVTAWTL